MTYVLNRGSYRAIDIHADISVHEKKLQEIEQKETAAGNKVELDKSVSAMRCNFNEVRLKIEERVLKNPLKNKDFERTADRFVTTAAKRECRHDSSAGAVIHKKLRARCFGFIKPREVVVRSLNCNSRGLEMVRHTLQKENVHDNDDSAKVILLLLLIVDAQKQQHVKIIAVANEETTVT
ncbi:unnamed protein product [Dovyalis caffra]|uniref:Uncharacterized protein n=1 Tax=Dovyalis caffra TaxID=77055 RepID=A0AAV1QS85_9ROSI|nr:unnamed protein product [Dovyalis caffra]